jgi:hypothetical protein
LPSAWANKRASDDQAEPMTDPKPAPDAPDASAQDAARIRRNKLFGRVVIIALGLLVVAQMAPMILRMLQHRLP